MKMEPCGEYLPMPLPGDFNISTYFVFTDQGRLYPGQTYQHNSEGRWVGELTLLFTTRSGALVIAHYPTSSTGLERDVCRGFVPR